MRTAKSHHSAHRGVHSINLSRALVTTEATAALIESLVTGRVPAPDVPAVIAAITKSLHDVLSDLGCS